MTVAIPLGKGMCERQVSSRVVGKVMMGASEPVVVVGECMPVEEGVDGTVAVCCCCCVLGGDTHGVWAADDAEVTNAAIDGCFGLARFSFCCCCCCCWFWRGFLFLLPPLEMPPNGSFRRRGTSTPSSASSSPPSSSASSSSTTAVGMCVAVLIIVILLVVGLLRLRGEEAPEAGGELVVLAGVFAPTTGGYDAVF